MTENSDPAAARKRRMEIMQSLRAENKKEAEAAAFAAAAAVAAAAATEVLPPKKRKINTKVAAAANVAAATAAAAHLPVERKGTEDTPINNDNNMEEYRHMDRDDDVYDSSSDTNNKKMQIRYDPEIPMSKEQLAAWRREARRVRNRESAAASRQRIRDRITELEIERDEWKTRFVQATSRLTQLERLARGGGGDGGSCSANGDD